MAKFQRDLVIANDDGKVYHLTQDQLEKLEPVDLSSDAYKLVSELLQQGVASAAIPTPDPNKGPQPDATCYLTNLAALKHAQIFEDE